MNLSTLETELNTAQLEAVTYCDGPSLVIAGAGAGKTRVLTYKIAWLIAHEHYSPWSILALTFTNKAATEMNSRIASLCGEMDIRGMWSGTFHSLFSRLLRREHEAANISANFSIYDSPDTKALLKAIIKEKNLDDKVYKPSIVAHRISEAKNRLITAQAYAADRSILSRDEHDKLGRISELYKEYQRRLAAAQALDFDDLLLRTYLLLHDNKETRERYKERFKYILVDEYQDTNYAQHKILSLLTDAKSRLCVVGDDAQSIYGFRGADISNILSFQKQYPTARVIKLECNYRSTQRIVEAANCIIRHNVGQIPKKVFSAGDEGSKLQLYNGKTDKEEAQKTAERVVSLYAQGVAYDQIALLYRTNAQSRSFEEVFRTANIPYRIYGGVSFYQRKEIKDLLAYCRLTVNPNDEEAFRRVVNYPTRGIGATTLQKVYLAAAGAGVSPYEVALHAEQYGTGLSAAVCQKLQRFCAMIESFREKATTDTASSVVKHILKASGMAADFMKDNSADNLSRRENADELLGSITAMEKDILQEQGRNALKLTEYLASVSLKTDTDEEDDGSPRVTLMTIHAAKGLEYEAVFVTGMEEELFPNSTAVLYPKEMEEERRLFYVAVTRAKRYCFLSYANTRYRYGQFQFCEPSRFIREIDEEYLERHDAQAYATDEDNFRSTPFGTGRNFYGSAANSERNSWQKPRGGMQSPRPVFPHSPTLTPFTAAIRKSNQSAASSASTSRKAQGEAAAMVGKHIQHERFGRGYVVSTEGEGASAMLNVNFDGVGYKKLLIKFAKFVLLDN